jgi:hypothetical protein
MALPAAPAVGNSVAATGAGVLCRMVGPGDGAEVNLRVLVVGAMVGSGTSVGADVTTFWHSVASKATQAKLVEFTVKSSKGRKAGNVMAKSHARSSSPVTLT